MTKQLTFKKPLEMFHFDTISRLISMISAKKKNKLKIGGSLQTLTKLYGPIICEGLDPDSYIAAVMISRFRNKEVIFDQQLDVSDEIKQKGFIGHKWDISFNTDDQLAYDEIVVFTSQRIYFGKIGNRSLTDK